MNEKISVLMSTYNESIDILERSIESILGQTYKNFEFVIINDNPKNILLDSCLERYRKLDSRIIIVKNKVNLGLVDSLNKGLDYCTGDYIVRMDADDISVNNRFEKQLYYLKTQGLDLVGTWYIKFDDKTAKRIEITLPVLHQECISVLKKNNCIAHPGWFAKRKVYEDLNGYRNIKTCEDYDFVIRTVLAGFKVGNIPEYLLYYRDNADGISNTNNTEQMLVARFLGHHYAERKSVNIEEYIRYLNSDIFQREKLKYSEMLSVKKSVKEHNSLKMVFKLALNSKFYVEKFDYYIYKLKKKKFQKKYGIR